MFDGWKSIQKIEIGKDAKSPPEPLAVNEFYIGMEQKYIFTKSGQSEKRNTISRKVKKANEDEKNLVHEKDDLDEKAQESNFIARAIYSFYLMLRFLILCIYYYMMPMLIVIFTLVYAFSLSAYKTESDAAD